MSVLMECIRLGRALPAGWPTMATPHPAAAHLDAADQAMRCARGAFASDAIGDAADFVAEARASLLDALQSLEARL